MTAGQQPRITTITVVAIEQTVDRFAEAVADGHLSPEEQQEIAHLLQGSYVVAQEADEGLRIGVALLRGGTQSVNARRYGFNPAAVDLSFA